MKKECVMTVQESDKAKWAFRYFGNRHGEAGKGLGRLACPYISNYTDNSILLHIQGRQH